MHRHRCAPVGPGRGVSCAAPGRTPAQVLGADTQGQTSIDHVPYIAPPGDIHPRHAPPPRSAHPCDTVSAWHRRPTHARRTPDARPTRRSPVWRRSAVSYTRRARAGQPARARRPSR